MIDADAESDYGLGGLRKVDRVIFVIVFVFSVLVVTGQWARHQAMTATATALGLLGTHALAWSVNSKRRWELYPLAALCVAGALIVFVIWSDEPDLRLHTALMLVTVLSSMMGDQLRRRA